MQVTWGQFCEKKLIFNDWCYFSRETTSKLQQKWINYAISGEKQSRYYQIKDKLFDLDKFEFKKFKGKVLTNYKFRFMTKFEGTFLKDGIIRMKIENGVIEFKTNKKKKIQNGTLCMFRLLTTANKSTLVATRIKPLKGFKKVKLSSKVIKLPKIPQKTPDLSDHDAEEKLFQPLNVTKEKAVKLSSLNSPTISDTTNQSQLIKQMQSIPTLNINEVKINNEQQHKYCPKNDTIYPHYLNDYYYDSNIKSGGISMFSYALKDSKHKALQEYPYMKNLIEKNHPKK